MMQKVEGARPGLRVPLWRQDMYDRGTQVRTIQSPGATICFMHMNDERIFLVFILHFFSLRRSVAYQ